MTYPLTPVTAFTGLTKPSRTDPATFPDRADAWVDAEGNAQDQFNVLAGQVNAMAGGANTDAGAASASAAAAAASVTAAAAQVALAQAAANAASSTANALPFNAATNYAQYGAALSLLNLRTYRRNTAGSSPTDPAIDPTNWSPAVPGTTLITATGTLAENHYIYSADVSVTMPDFSVAKQFSLTTPSNLPTLTNNPTTSDGWTVNLGFSAGSTKTAAPLAFGSPHGWWGSLTMTPPLNGTSAAVGSGSLSVIASVALSATCHVYVLLESVTPGMYAIAVDPTTGLWGAPVTLAATSGSGWIYAVSSTSFVYVGAGGQFARAGSLSGTTITLGASQALSANPTDAPIQLTATTYLVSVGAATNNLFVLSVSGTTISLGTAVTAQSAANAGVRLAPISPTAAIIAYATAGTSPTSLTARVVSISGTTLTLNTAAVSATSVIQGNTSPFASLFTVSAGASYIFCATNSTSSSDGSWYGITVSGTTVTIGTVSVQTSVLWTRYQRSTFIYRHGTIGAGGSNWLYGALVNSTTVLGLLGTGGSLIAVSISGTTLTFGAVFSSGSPQGILTDITTGLNLYSTGTATYSKLSITGTTISTAYTLASQALAVFSDSLSDKAVNYGGTWYSWSGVPALFFPISTTKFANVSSNVLRSYGNYS